MEKRHFKLDTKPINASRAALSSFFLCSLFLSLTILLRFFFPVGLALNVMNVLLFGLLYFIIPMASVICLLKKTVEKKLWLLSAYFMFLVGLYLFIFWAALNVPSIPQYLLVAFGFPVPLLVAFSHKWKIQIGRTHNWRGAIKVISLLVIAVLLPNVVAFIGVNGLLSQAGGIRSDAEKSEFLSKHIIDLTAYGWCPRAENDYYQFLISGAGSCGEMAMASENLMNAAGLDVRKVVFPGEDHAFVEVKINGNWMIPNGATLLTRENATENRINGVGSLTYVAAPTEDSFIELTQEYVSTDTIIIQIVKDKVPMINANLVLKHTFNHQEHQLPFTGGSFHTDNSGTVILHLGKPHYIKEYTGSEEYYWIWVDGQNTNRTVTSTGTGAIQSLRIDLPR